MKTNLFSENDFFEIHERFKAQEYYLLRCVQVDRPNGRFYLLTWIESLGK